MTIHSNTTPDPRAGAARAASLIAVFMLVLTSGGAVASSEDSNKPAPWPRLGEIEISLQVTGKIFEIGETIACRVTIKNVGLNPVRVYKPVRTPLANDYQIRILGVDGKRIKGYFPVETDVVAQTINLRPGESISHQDCLNRWAVIDRTGDYIAFSEYIYFVHTEYGSMAAGRAESEPVTFTVTPPTASGKDYRLAEARRLAALAKERDLYSQIDASRALSYTLDSRAIADIVDLALEPENNPEIPSSLNRLNDYREIQKQLLEALESRGPTATIAVLLRDFGISETISGPLLVKWLKQGTPTQVSHALLGLAFFKNGLPAGSKGLVAECLRNKSAEVRHNAAQVCAIHLAEAGPIIAQMAVADSDKQVRLRALTSIGQHLPNLLVKVAPALLKDKDRDIVSAAIEALRLSESPDAVNALRDFVKAGTGSAETLELANKALSNRMHNR